jgi:hypothetical protein
MSNKKTWTFEELEAAVSTSRSYRQVLKTLGLNPDGGASNALIKREVAKLKLDTSHFVGKGHLKGKKHNWTKAIPLEELLKANTPVSSSSRLKKRLIAEGILEEKCRKCGLENQWQNEPISLHLEHINGDETDNRRENLEILCPNCHSQTKTYCRQK